MNKCISFGLLFFILSVKLAFTQTTQPHQLLLNLNEGDSFSYEVKSSKSYLLTYPKDSVLRSMITRSYPKDSVLKSIITRSKHTFYVEGKIPGNKYLINYKIDYEITEDWSGSEVKIKDSRFPPFTNNAYHIAECFLNTIEYKILFSPLKNSMQVLNRKEIDKKLMEYLKERGVHVSEYLKKELGDKHTNYGILKQIQFMKFYPEAGNYKQNWTIDQVTGDTENYTVLGEKDTSISILSTRPYTEHSEETGLVLGESMNVMNRMNIHKETGLIQRAESASYLLPDSTRTEGIYQYRPDITDFRSIVELVDFSRWRIPTILTGRINNPSVKKLCLVSTRGIVGSKKDYHYIELDSDGGFSETIDTKVAKRYQLYLLENYPIWNNSSIQLYIEPGDSIYITSESSSINENVSFSGKGYQNSEFLNDFYYKYNKYYLRYLGPDFRHYFTLLYRKYDDLEELIKILPEMSDNIEDRRIVLSQGFYDYWKFAFSCISQIADIIFEYRKNATLDTDKFQFQKTIEVLPDTLNPLYNFNTNMEEYITLVGVHSMYQNEFIIRMHPGKRYAGFSNMEKISFAKLIFEGYPLYVEATRLTEMLRHYISTQYHRQLLIYQTLLNGCNNQEVRDYIIDQYEVFSRFQKGNDKPVMELVGMDGKKMNWRRTKGKVVILMLHNEYTWGQKFCEKIFHLFGKNKEGVIVLRISPGFDYKSWKDFNERYSDKGFQMFFTGEESAFRDQFLMIDTDYDARYLIIGKDGKIFTNPRRNALIRETDAALKEEAPPNEFLKALWSRILPGALLGIVLTFIFYRFINRRRLAKHLMERKMAELEQKAIKAQLNPHFLFNCLNSIQNLIRTDRKNEADRYLSKFAVLIRQVLKNSEKEEISISEELKGLELYLELEQMRFNFDYEILSDEKVDIHNVMIPPMLLHPVVENAILHGLDAKKGDKKLTIGIHESGESIQFLIEDNGVGRNPESTRDSSDESRGLKLMENRMEILRKSSREDYNFKITDKKDQYGNSAGTCVEILIPDEK